MSVARAIMASMSIDNELLRSLCDHPATGPRLVEYLVTGEWAKRERSVAIPTSDAVTDPDEPAGCDRLPSPPPWP